MATPPVELKDEFPLNIVAPILKRFQPPSGPFRPEGDWELRYGVHTIGQRGSARVGSLCLRRKAQADGGCVLSLDYTKPFAGGFTTRTTGEMHCRGDALATPVQWRLTSQTLNREGRTIPHTKLERLGRARDSVIEIGDGKMWRTLPVSAPYTVNWALFEAVQRLPREAFPPKRFTLLDDFDEVKPGQSLSFRKSVEVMMGGRQVQRHTVRQLEKGRIRTTSWGRVGARPVRLHACDLVGPGLVPVVFWVDEQGRLLFVVSGLEAYLYEPPKA